MSKRALAYDTTQKYLLFSAVFFFFIAAVKK